MGLVGSMGIILNMMKAGLAHHFSDTCVSMAKLARSGRKAESRGPSRKDVWLATITAFLPAAL